MSTTTPRAPYGSAQHSEPSRWQHIGSYILLVLIAIGDAANFKVAFALKYPNVEDLIINSLVATATLAALISMAFAGHEARQVAAGDPSGHRALVPVAILFWLGLGATAFAVRLTAPAPAGATTDSGAFALAGAQQSASGWIDELPAAALFLFVYLCCGLVAYLIAYAGFNPLRRKFMVARNRQRRAQRRARTSAAQLARAASTHETLEADTAEWEKRHRATIERLEALAQEAKAHSRLEIARHLGEPGDTSGVLRKPA